ncbi:hypothetical protein J8F10_18380 [Gemmata sp. G18]|uniref:Lipoprotein n=1 Tax=Gemmata palustris TaxID=2822762 RepID=A0ABS5BU34_9BACT|nr:hypothetical protein [Gemmata palustris]MBP3957232.1 hypothetical protein [Gemmata palustris]
MPTRFALAVCALGLFLATGCGPAKLDQKTVVSVDAGDTKSIDLDAQPKPQKITIDFSSSAGSVSVYVFKEADAKGEKGLEDAEANKAKALAAKESKGEAFAVDVPENTAIRIIFFATKKTDVTVKLTNR